MVCSTTHGVVDLDPKDNRKVYGLHLLEFIYKIIS